MIRVEIQEKDETLRQLNVEVAQEEVDREFSEVTEGIQRHAALPGFRKGKVPKALISKNYFPKIREEVLERLFGKSYRQALEQTQLVPIVNPKIQKMELEPGKPMLYEVTLEVLPKVKIGNYKGLKLKAAPVSVGAEEVEQVVERLREQSAALETVSGRPARKGDIVTVDFQGSENGIPVAGVKASDFQLELGKGQAIPDFENNLEGLEAASQKKFSATFPDDYPHGNLAGKMIEFEVTLKSVLEKKLPPLDDEFAKKAGAFSSLAELRERIEKDLREEKERQRKNQLRQDALQSLGGVAQVKVPKTLLDRSLENLYRDEQKKRRGPEGKEFEGGGDDGEARKVFWKEHGERVEKQLKCQLALHEVSRSEKIRIEETEIQAELERLARASRQSLEKLRGYFSQGDRLEELADRLRDDKTLDLILAAAKISEK